MSLVSRFVVGQTNIGCRRLLAGMRHAVRLTAPNRRSLRWNSATA